MPDKLDQFDRSILEVVQRDCQLKAEAIADKVGLSPSAVQRRLRRLRDEGIITAEIAVVNRKATSFPMTFITGMEIERDNYDALTRFRAWADKQSTSSRSTTSQARSISSPSSPPATSSITTISARN